MAEPTLEYWFEFASTYSHVATHRLEPLARAAGVKLVWRPFLLGPIFKGLGWNTSPFNLQPAKGAYMWRDVARESEKHGIPFRKPSEFPRNGLLAARVVTASEAEPFLPELVRAVYLANFRDDRDISDASVVRELLVAVGSDAPDALLARAGSPEVKDLLRRRTDDAIARGTFGAPSFFANGELFWGNDRLEDALAWCNASGRGKLTPYELEPEPL
ncbi:MAG TPA: 2-hydroxychromene-2-carboxylate isomerase [Polyangiaceae bacterium]|jgi:2-hydroxychromene-2-carboxylate isomerase|nr:2-hydroxychromene-2-carboxylate isomerase [Polyangiaceae bacterium]